MSLVTIARRRKASSKLLHIDTSRLFDNAEYDKHRRAERINHCRCACRGGADDLARRNRFRNHLTSAGPCR